MMPIPCDLLRIGRCLRRSRSTISHLGRSPQMIAVSVSLLVMLSLVLQDTVGAEPHVTPQLRQSRPEPPPRLPPNRARPGGGLDVARQSCNATDPVTALVPIENPVLTTAAYPSLFVYIPDSPEAVNFGEFSVFTADEKTQVYAARFLLPQIPGIVRVSLPESAEVALEPNQTYRWYFKLYCHDVGTDSSGADDSRSDLNVNGWMQRVELTPQRQRQIEAFAPDIWYDSLAGLAEQLQVAPEDSMLKARWDALLQSADLTDLAEVQLVGEVEPMDGMSP